MGGDKTLVALCEEYNEWPNRSKSQTYETRRGVCVAIHKVAGRERQK